MTLPSSQLFRALTCTSSWFPILPFLLQIQWMAHLSSKSLPKGFPLLQTQHLSPGLLWPSLYLSSCLYLIPLLQPMAYVIVLVLFWEHGTYHLCSHQQLLYIHTWPSGLATAPSQAGWGLIRLALFDVGGPHPFTEGPSRTKRKQEEEFSPSLLMAWTEPWIFSCPWCSRDPGLQTRAEFQHPCPESPAPRKKTVGLLSLRKCIHPIGSLSLFNLTSTSVIRSCSILRVCALCLFFPRVPPHFLSG